MKETAAIEVRDLTMAYGGRVVMRDLSFQVRRGEIFVIMGGSGGGKSTLLKHLIGLKKPAGREFGSAHGGPAAPGGANPRCERSPAHLDRGDPRLHAAAGRPHRAPAARGGPRSCDAGRRDHRGAARRSQGAAARPARPEGPIPFLTDAGKLRQIILNLAANAVKGTIVVAAVQGAIGGVLFALLGIQAAVFWGVAMGVLSLLPAVGAALVWVPAAVVLLATGAFWKAMALIAGGTLAIGLVDNVLRPILIGRETRMPDYLVLVATLGGLTVFGLAGFVAGPVIAALFLVTWQMFADEYAPLDSSVPPEGRAGLPALPSGSATLRTGRTDTLGDGRDHGQP
jgi:energy-coupling factor transporter ATP-binding protein EcfA2